jgi:hypothetical protein
MARDERLTCRLNPHTSPFAMNCRLYKLPDHFLIPLLLRLDQMPNMACFYCNADTVLYINSKPLCFECVALIDAGKPPKKPVTREAAEPAHEKTRTAGSA